MVPGRKLKTLHDAPHDDLVDWCLYGNWRTFLSVLTDGDSDQVDALFQKLVRRHRRPGTSHRYLAFLARLLGWRLVLTINFDDLIEQAMCAESLDPVVYDIVLDARLPDPALMKNHLSVVKLHGGRTGFGSASGSTPRSTRRAGGSGATCPRTRCCWSPGSAPATAGSWTWSRRS